MMRWMPLALPLLGAMTLTTAVAAAEPGAPAVPALDELKGFEDLPERWSEIMDDFRVPGMAVAVLNGGRVAAVQGFGERNPEGNPVTPETMFYIASITKVYMATAICGLAERGLIGLDDPVRRLLPRFHVPDKDRTRETTVRDLLCHRAGINSGEIVLLDAYTGEITEDRYYHWLERAELTDGVTYSNVHYTLLGRVLEAQTGKPWRDALDEIVFRPAGLTRTTGYASRLYTDKDHAVPMEFEDGSWRATTQVKTDDVMHAAGGLGTSALDGAAFLEMHLNDGSANGRRVLGPLMTKSMRLVQSGFDEPQGSIRIMDGFGLGWQVGTYNGERICAHGGGYIGASAYYLILPDRGAGFVILMNAGGPANGLGDIIAIDLLERLTGTEPAWDVFGRYTGMIADRIAQHEQEERDARTERAGTERPVDPSIAGRYENPFLGTLTIEIDAGEPSGRLGSCVLDLTGLGERELVIHGPVAEETVLRAANGTPVPSLTATDEGGEEFVFERINTE